MNRTDRLMAIILQLQAKGWQRAEDLATTFEISKRTVYRDMQALSESGVPVVSSPGQGFTLVDGYFLPPVSLTADEALALMLGGDFVTQTFDAEFKQAAEAAMNKIRVILPERLRENVDSLSRSMRLISINTMSSDNVSQRLLRQIRTAIIQQRTIRFEYHTRHPQPGEPMSNIREADPYGILHLDRGWLVVAYCHLRDDVRYFRIDRMSGLQTLLATFDRPADFDVMHRPEKQHPVVVKALFAPSVVRWVQEQPPFFQVDQEEREDGLLITFRIRQESEIISWLMSWGANVQVLEPESLRQQIADHARAILENSKMAETLLP